MRTSPPFPITCSSAASAGRRDGRSPCMRAADRAACRPSQSAKTMPVRSAPLIAEPGRYGPEAPAANVGMFRRLARWRGSSRPNTPACSKGMRRSAKFCAKPPHEAKSSLSARLELREIAIQARALGQQLEDAPLVEHIDLVLPDHVVDGGKLAAVADQHRRQAREAVSHGVACPGIGIASAKPAR